MMMARAKRIYILIVKVNKLCFRFSSRCFLKEIEDMFLVFLSSYSSKRIHMNSKKLGKHLPAVCVPTAFLVLPNFQSCFYLPTRRWFSMFYKKIMHA